MNRRLSEITGLANIIDLTHNDIKYYMKLSKSQKAKYNKLKTEVSMARAQEYALIDHSVMTDELTGIIQNKLLIEIANTIVSTSLKQFRYHSGKPLTITLTEQGPTKYLPLIRYFESNSEYLKDYDYIILSDRHYATLLDENFLYTRSYNDVNYSSSLLSTYPANDIRYDTLIKKAGKFNNLDLYVTNMPEQDGDIMFDAIIGKKEWAEGDIIHFGAYEGDNGDHATYNINMLFRLMFPIKRGFMRLQAKYENK